jgi:hypothetical protein
MLHHVESIEETEEVFEESVAVKSMNLKGKIIVAEDQMINIEIL